jgi:ABC-type bacteriocin/lantibiotic exporter with double-glycine peptidase domain
MKPRAVVYFLLTFMAALYTAHAAQPPGTWLDVPFVAQTRDGCGSAAISMVMRYWENRAGRAAPDSADPQRIQAALYSPAARGILSSSMREYFRASGYSVFSFPGNWADLEHHVEKGRPLIVSLKASGPFEPLHYVVVVGIDRERGFVFLNDPAQQKRLRISREGFESEWNPAHNWTLLALPPSTE